MKQQIWVKSTRSNLWTIVDRLSEMDEGDYSKVKELITSKSNRSTNSLFDGDSVVFYGSAKDESFPRVQYASKSHVLLG